MLSFKIADILQSLYGFWKVLDIDNTMFQNLESYEK